jgi:hypothetical protein
MRVRITRKLAEWIDGVDLSHHAVGDVIEVTRHEAELLFAEDWAVRAAQHPRTTSRTTTRVRRTTAEDDIRRLCLAAEFVREHQHRGGYSPLGPQQRRRAEDFFREELRDSRARTISARLPTVARRRPSSTAHA